MDSTILYGAVAFAACYILKKKKQRKKRKGGRLGTHAHIRIRRSVESVYNEMGDELFRRAYRMTYPTFLELHRLLQPEILKMHRKYQVDTTIRHIEQRGGERKRIDERRWDRFVTNGLIATTTRLAIALRYFAGGSLYDLAPLFGVGRSDAYRSVWLVVEAVHRTKEFNLCFPRDHDAQRELARQFSTRSQAGFQCCVGAVDGILIWQWTEPPSR